MSDTLILEVIFWEFFDSCLVSLRPPLVHFEAVLFNQCSSRHFILFDSKVNGSVVTRLGSESWTNASKGFEPGNSNVALMCHCLVPLSIYWELFCCRKWQPWQRLVSVIKHLCHQEFLLWHNCQYHLWQY